MMDNNWEEAGFRRLEYTEFKRLPGCDPTAKQSIITLART